MSIAIDIDLERIAEFCREHHISRLALFGSALRQDFSSESDVDLLVEFMEGHGPGYIGLSRLELDLEEILGREVDLKTPGEISEHFRDEVLGEAEVIFEQARS